MIASTACWLGETSCALSAQVLLETYSATTAFNLSHAEEESGSGELFRDAPHRHAALSQLAQPLSCAKVLQSCATED